MIHRSCPTSPASPYTNTHAHTGYDMRKAKSDNAVPESNALFSQALQKKKYPCRKERGIKQRQDGEKRQGEKLGRSHGNQRGSKRKLVFKRGSRFMHV